MSLETGFVVFKGEVNLWIKLFIFVHPNLPVAVNHGTKAEEDGVLGG